MKILFDTDPGIDDAMALLMLARDRRAELVGITTVFGNASVDTTTANALSLCERFMIEAPVARGASKALVNAAREFPWFIHGHDGMGDTSPAPATRRGADPAPAPEFISALARRYSRELTIVAVGPLTNLALALQRDPALVEHVERVVVMGGAFGERGHRGNISPVAEANFYNDPHAADIVMTARWPVTVVGLDVTHEIEMTNAYLAELAQSGGEEGRFIWEITRVYEAFCRERTGDGIYSHDASAVACALDPSAFTLRHGPVRVVTEGAALGQSIQVTADFVGALGAWGQAPPQAVCVGVDADRVRVDFRACLAGHGNTARSQQGECRT